MSDSMPKLNPVAVHAALANAQRLQMFQLMVGGQELTILGLVKTTGRSYRAVHKDMDVLCASGAVTWRFGKDKRVGLFYIPEVFRPQPGTVDLGFCQLRFPSTRG